MDKGEGRGKQAMGCKAVDGKDQRCCLGAHPALLTIPLTSLGPGSPPDVIELCGNQLSGLSLQSGKATDGIEGTRQADQAE